MCEATILHAIWSATMSENEHLSLQLTIMCLLLLLNSATVVIEHPNWFQ
jgi:hypothetical protein